jgi:hypothetical protein
MATYLFLIKRANPYSAPTVAQIRSGDKKGMPASAAYPRLFGSRIADLHLEWMAAWPSPGGRQSRHTDASWTVAMKPVFRPHQVVALVHADRIVYRRGSC